MRARVSAASVTACVLLVACSTPGRRVRKSAAAVAGSERNERSLTIGPAAIDRIDSSRQSALQPPLRSAGPRNSDRY